MLAVWVAIGSAAGGVARYGVAVWLSGMRPAGIPVATWLVNALGSAAFGILLARQAQSPLPTSLYLGLTTGVLGGFTTYSTFNAELLQMAIAGSWRQLAGYLALTITGCFAGGALGYWLATRAANG